MRAVDIFRSVSFTEPLTVLQRCAILLSELCGPSPGKPRSKIPFCSCAGRNYGVQRRKVLGLRVLQRDVVPTECTPKWKMSTLMTYIPLV